MEIEYRTKLHSLLLLILLSFSLNTFAQISGFVSDAKTGEALQFVNVYYENNTSVGTTTDSKGFYRLPVRSGLGKLIFSYMGYVTRKFPVQTNGVHQLNVKLQEDTHMLGDVIVNPGRNRYSRKNNPAVEMIRKVIANKKNSDLSAHDFYQYNKYEKLTLAINEVTDKTLEHGLFKKIPYIAQHVEPCAETGKNILPLSVDETVSEKVYRKNPHSEKTIIKGQNSQGIGDLLNTGDILSTVLNDAFTEVNLYDNNIRLFQHPFVSPLSGADAVSFYRFYINDTIMLDNEKCFHMTFVPNNSRDFGFTGHLYILADSSYQLKRCVLNLPKKSDVNFIEHLIITQDYEQLPSGESVIKYVDMIAEVLFNQVFNKFQVRRTTYNSGYAFEEVPKQIFRKKGDLIHEAEAQMRDEDFWKQYRHEPLTESESSIDMFIHRIEQMKGFKYIIFGARALIENFVETGTKEKPSKVDIGPINTMLTSNRVDGVRMRLSALTTANFNKHLFFSGYAAYGLKDRRVKGKFETTYSFNAKEYLPREYPKNNLSASFMYDIMSPSDQFLKTDKDNVFTSFKWTKVDQMMYVRNYQMKYEREFLNGFSFTVDLKNSNREAADEMHFMQLNGKGDLSQFRTTEASLGLRYAPGETFVNTKQRRVLLNLDAPVFMVSHTMGLNKVLGADYKFNYTEVDLFKRFWLPRSWGRIDVWLKGGAQWNKVPYPLLIMPAANLSYIVQYETFNLINNMEFLNDRFASLDVSWDMKGKIFNRIPLLRSLKWREFIGCKVLWGKLTDKNSPFTTDADGATVLKNDDLLFDFPYFIDAEGNKEYRSFVMDQKKPYVELIFGVHNIFKLLHVEYVRRMTYLDLPTAQKWGVRFMVRMTF